MRFKLNQFIGLTLIVIASAIVILHYDINQHEEHITGKENNLDCDISTLSCRINYLILAHLTEWSKINNCSITLATENYTNQNIKLDLVTNKLLESKFKSRDQCRATTILFKYQNEENMLDTGANIFIQISIFKENRKIYEDNLSLTQKKTR